VSGRTPSDGTLAPGEIVLEHATRTFSVRADQARTLRGALRARRVDRRLRTLITALDDVSLRIASGETVGMVGRNGAGKSSTLRALAGIVPLQSGSARCGGRAVSLLELGAGFSRDFSGRENIYLQGALFGFQRGEIERRIDQIISFSGLAARFIEAPVRTYSQGMFLRLGFSIAAHLDADVLLIDEVLAVGDEEFQRRCLERISQQIAGGATLLLVSHELAAIERVCERVIVLDGGRVAFDGPTTEGLAHYRALLGVQHGGGVSLRPHRPGAVEVADLELRDGAGHAASVFRGGEPLAVALALRRPPQAGARVRLELRRGETVLFASETALGESAAAVCFEVGELPLLGGDYELAAGAAGAEEPLALQRSVRFAVAREPGERAEGLIDLRGRWRELDAALAPASVEAGR
jgi:ABC-type polysaccharide/polyol phosphate transport system ATPase subunit